MRPQRGASWRLDSHPAARFTSLPNVIFPFDNPCGNLQFCFHKTVKATGLEISFVNEVMQGLWL